MQKPVIGIIGVGLMGHGIASNIQKSGWPIGLYDHPGNQNTDEMVAAGASVHHSLSSITAASDIIILCVTGSPEVEKILTASDGVLSAIKSGTIIIDCSTAIPASTITLAKQVSAAGARFTDAPMTRTRKEAAEGRLNLLVGAELNLFNEIHPLLESFAENIVHAGEVGSGHALKLLHNFVSLGFSGIIAEATAAAKKANIDNALFQSVLAKGGGAGVVLDRMTPYIIDQDVGVFEFTVSNSAKDLSYYTTMCEDLNAESGIANAVGALFSDQVAKGNESAFVPELISLL